MDNINSKIEKIYSNVFKQKMKQNIMWAKNLPLFFYSCFIQIALSTSFTSNCASSILSLVFIFW